MRCTQVIGLSPRAETFLKENKLTQLEKCDCPTCITPHVLTDVSKKYRDAADFGMFDDGPMLYKHWLKDGSIAYEYVLAAPWSSGPCIFLALSSTQWDGTEKSLTPIVETLWTEEEINNA